MCLGRLRECASRLAVTNTEMSETNFVTRKTFRAYLITQILSLILAVAGISYNGLRLVESEENANVRDAAFQMLVTLAEFQQVIYAAHYDKLPVEGSPRLGWTKVLLVEDLSVLVGDRVAGQAEALRLLWQRSWSKVTDDRESTDQMVSEIDVLRDRIKERLAELK